MTTSLATRLRALPAVADRPAATWDLAAVVAHEHAADSYYRLTLSAPSICTRAQAGQILLLLIRRMEVLPEVKIGVVVDKAPQVAPEVNLSVTVGGVSLANPVMPASGCFGPELAPLLPLQGLGAVVAKTVFAVHRAGNPAHRLTETPCGVLNSVGIPSPGSDAFKQYVLPAYQASGTNVVVSIGGLDTREYFTVAEDLADIDIAAFEINVSCPNLEHGLPLGTSAQRTAEIVSGIRRRVRQPLWVKLTPAVTNIGDIARAAQDAGADAVTVSNSFSGLSINIYTRASTLGSGAGGYTGPAVKPLAVKLVRDAAAAVTIPVIGCGGITTAEDVAEFLIAGATAVQVGTATFTRPTAMAEIISNLTPLCHRLNVSTMTELIGTLDNWAPAGSNP